MTPKVRKVLEKILLWPSDEDESKIFATQLWLLFLQFLTSWLQFIGAVSKVQHGCIDCLALMICAELQHPESSKTMKGEKLRKYCCCMSVVLLIFFTRLAYKLLS